VITTAGGGIDALVCQPNQLQIINSANVRQLNPSTYEAVFAKAAAFFLENPAAGASLIEFAMFPTQAMASVPDAETSFPWRDARAFLYVMMILHLL
jgi:hypothetical protein